MAVKSQCDRIHEAMKRGEAVTQLDAWARFGVSRLAARIYDLKEQGVEIASESVEVQNRFGEECRVKRYRLATSAA